MFHGKPLRKTFIQLFAMAMTLWTLAGCGPDRILPYNAPPPGNTSLTGNWQIAATTTAGTQPFSALTGSIVQGAAGTDGASPLFAILQTFGPGTCFQGLTTVPLEGTLTGSSASLLSLSDGGQYVTLSGTGSSDYETITGTFSISGGCANGVKGNLNGSRMTALSGTYSGPSTIGAGGNTLSITVTQDSFSDGFGYFHLAGSSTFTGISCFTGGTLDSSSSTISGQNVHLLITAPGTTPSTVTMNGTLNTTATQLTITSLLVTSGSCVGQSGTANLTS
jgi:hypothetical protein